MWGRAEAGRAEAGCFLLLYYLVPWHFQPPRGERCSVLLVGEETEAHQAATRVLDLREKIDP